jgi:hypothetical protein
MESKYERVRVLSAEDFRRLTGVKPDTFTAMLAVLEEAEAKRTADFKYQGGRKPKLCMADKLLLTLEYLREYRTQFHIGQSYGIGEYATNGVIKWVENTLIKSGLFSLPGKKALLKSDVEWTMVVVDATETAIERPKKNKSVSTRAKRKSIR